LRPKQLIKKAKSMKKNVKSIIALICVGFALMSCSKTDTTPAAAPTVMALHCVDGSGNPVQGASVTLYNNSTDWLNTANAAYTGTTDANGNVSFSGVSSQVYYFWCLNATSCLANLSAQVTQSALTANVTNNFTVVLTAYGKLSVTNTSASDPTGYTGPYEIKVNGNVWQNSLAAGANATELLPVGNITVEAIQLSGYTFSATDSTYSLTISQCNVTQKNIP